MLTQRRALASIVGLTLFEFAATLYGAHLGLFAEANPTVGALLASPLRAASLAQTSAHTFAHSPTYRADRPQRAVFACGYGLRVVIRQEGTSAVNVESRPS